MSMTRKEALKAISAFVENYACDSDLDGLREAIEALEEQRPHGEWTRSELGYVCSACGNIVPHCFMPTISVLTKDAQYNFCPNCGADMRVKDELNRVRKELNSEIKKSKSEIIPDYRDGWRKRGEAECYTC